MMLKNHKDQHAEKTQPVSKKKKKGAAAEKNEESSIAGGPGFFYCFLLGKIGWEVIFINPKLFEDNIIKDST
ncbi:hypothetical protein M5V91_13770 [Cytobacillus pseudoceanisediminis]|uniref:hypothetical protein n=1 Tax=Cytobacillus pseudoceanisediminis TaxID=3051614 RepID=UPI0021894D3F|nr:hypothetical protein [Cytobacillus pseudoceanisediminis]UQX56533.1 hypothetical protein M5V91_13770 [Cytobacillus pseudoceanisediminis]